MDGRDPQHDKNVMTPALFNDAVGIRARRLEFT
jgi:hypothetical protein